MKAQLLLSALVSVAAGALQDPVQEVDPIGHVGSDSKDQSVGGHPVHDDLEKKLKEKIGVHLEQVERQIRAIEYMLDTHYNSQYNYTEEDAHDYVSNPINTYMLIKRTAMDWPNVKEIIFNATVDEDFREIQELVNALDTRNLN